jgi:hypothetical protein
VYSPINLIVVPDDKRNDVLKKVYEDITQGPGQTPYKEDIHITGICWKIKVVNIIALVCLK